VIVLDEAACRITPAAGAVGMRALELSDRIGRVGLRARVVILVLLAIAPLFCLLIYGAISDRELALVNARARAVELARFGAQRQADMLQQGRELLIVMRRMPEIIGDDPDVCRMTAREIAADHPQFLTIGVVDPDGVIRCHSKIAHRQAFGDVALHRRAMAPDAPRFIVGQFLISVITGKPVVVMASPLPKAADGALRGIVFASLNLESFQQVSAELAGADHAGGSDQVVLVIDPRNGKLLARGPDNAQMLGRVFADHPLVRAMVASPEGGGLDAEELDGVPRIFGFARLPIAGGVMIAVGLSRSDVLADANKRLVIGLSIAVLAMMGALAAAWLVGHASQLRPIRHLVDTAQMLGRGDLSARTVMESWQAPEFRMLGATLNSMAEAIALGQRNLRDSEAELRLLADNATDMIFKLDLDFRRTYVSPSSRELLGYEPHELIGKRPASMAHPDDYGQVSDSYHDLVSGQERAMTITRIRHRDGHWIWIEVHKRALLDPETGAPIGIIGSMRDISARKAAEESVRASEALLRGVFDHTSDCILVNSVAADGTFLLETYNPAAAAVIGFPVGVMNGRPLRDTMVPAVAAKVKDSLDQCLASGQALAFPDAVMSNTGRRTWDITLTPLVDGQGRIGRIITTARETTENKLAADLVRQNRERYQLIADNVADLVVRLDRDLACGFVSPASRDLLGCEPEELVALPLVEIVHPDDCGAFQDDMARLQTTSEIDEFRFRARHTNGSYIWVEATGRKLGDRGSIILTIRDISRRKQTEDELAAANCQLKTLATQDGLTGLANRRSFDEVFDREWLRATREKTSLGLIMLDVDKFKVFNDVYGHQAGDEALCAVARAIEAALLRPADFVARYGGEEFVIVLPVTDEAGTIEVAERIRQSVEAKQLEHRGNAGGIVTISAGVWASHTALPVTHREALKSADANLYSAKAAGRNRVGYGCVPVAMVG
jgi:diguanylate cyclase (GGDEF)-like protein/PAS domain S-box-containing protein